jgi:hypothetical protein
VKVSPSDKLGFGIWEPCDRPIADLWHGTRGNHRGDHVKSDRRGTDSRMDRETPSATRFAVAPNGAAGPVDPHDGRTAMGAAVVLDLMASVAASAAAASTADAAPATKPVKG